MTRLFISNYKVVKMNRNSIQLSINGEDYFATRRIANKIFEGSETNLFIVEKDYNGKVMKWLALPSIF